MNKINIFYWICTGLFGAFMMFSAIPDLIVSPEAVTFFDGLGYPTYLIPFLGVAKALGVIALFIPGFPKIREWAYAGLFFDLIGATYSNLCTTGLEPSIFFMILPFFVGGLSYGFHHVRLREQGKGF